MSYTKLTFSSLLLLTVAACSTGQSPVKNEVPTSNSQSSKSTKIELGVYTDALIALNKNELDKAQQLFTKMSKLQPEIAGSWANLALISVKKEQYEEAEKWVKVALQKNPKMVQSLNLLASLEQRKGNIVKAESLYLEALAYNPKYALAQYNLALLYDIYFQDIPKAINHYQLYLDNTKNKDEQTAQWLAGLKSTIGAE
jgi:Tfp pilus assembly protein PilF